MLPDYSKIKSTILFITKNCEKGLNGLTLSKLNKILYFIDFGHFAKYQTEITSMGYLKFKFGPVPRGLRDYLDLFEADGVIDKRKVINDKGEFTVYETSENISLKEHGFQESEIEVITKTVGYFSDKYSKVASNESHYHYSWITTKNGSIISTNKAKYCDFPWIDYFNDKNKEEYEEVNKSRKKFMFDDDLGNLMKQIQSA